MKRIISINIGGFYATARPTVITTILGPCVAVCLHDPGMQIGGMNHIFLPGKADPNDSKVPSRYSIDATELLIDKMIKLGANRNNLTAKIFGGAHVLPAASEMTGVGKKISASVVDCLHNAGIRIIEQDLGGCKARKIYLHTDTGEVLLKRMDSTLFTKIVLPRGPYNRKEINSMAQCIEKKQTLGGDQYPAGYGKTSVCRHA